MSHRRRKNGQRLFLVRYKGDPTCAGALRHKIEIEMNGWRDAKGNGHAHLGGVLVDFSLHVCGSCLWD